MVQALSRTTRRCSRVSPTWAPAFGAGGHGRDRGMVQVGDHPPFQQMLLDDARHVLFPDVEIVDAVGIDGQDHPFADDADAAAFQDLDLLLQLSRLQLASPAAA